MSLTIPEGKKRKCGTSCHSSPLHLACRFGRGLFVKQMLQQSTTYPRLPNPMTGQTAANLALLAWLENQVKQACLI